jgi:hypothetical protein
MSQFWWVNHKQTVRQEIAGQYLWSPKTKSNGAANVFYDNMRRARPGDIVLSYANQAIGHIGRVTEYAVTAPKPAEFGDTGTYWASEGWYLPVFWTRLNLPVRPKTLLDTLQRYLPRRYSPISPETGAGNQGVYLAHIDEAVFQTVVAGTSFDRDTLARGGTNSLTFQAVVEHLDDIVQQRIANDRTLDETTRQSVIQARRGQGLFRRKVETIEPACRLTGITTPSLLIASHIKPWRMCSTSEERLDGMNGLMLTPDADLLFDRGFISFENTGEVLVSPLVDRDDLSRLGFQQLAWEKYGFGEAPIVWRSVEGFAAKQCRYLDYHRKEVFCHEYH